MNQTSQKVRFLVFDVETVADGELISRARYPSEMLSPDQAVARYREELIAHTGRDVLPPTWVVPVSVAVAKVGNDFRLQELCVLDEPQFRPEEITRRFWQGWEHYGRPTLVSFNGRGYDLPVLELMAFRHAVSLPAWFNVDSRSYEQTRNRYNIDRHIDLQDLLSNFGAVRMSGGLNLLANMIEKPGKSGVDGSQVQDFYNAGRVDEINDYCRCDVLDTYFVFLRTRVLLGKLSPDEEQEIVDMTRQWLEEHSAGNTAFGHYLEAWNARSADLVAQPDVFGPGVREESAPMSRPT